MIAVPYLMEKQEQMLFSELKVLRLAITLAQKLFFKWMQMDTMILLEKGAHITSVIEFFLLFIILIQLINFGWN